MSPEDKELMRKWARDHGKCVRQRTVRKETTKYKVGTLGNPNKVGIPGVQGWRSGESTRLPPMWPRFDSLTRRHMWVEFVGSLLCTERFSPGTPVSPLLKNQHLTCCVNC